MKSPLAHLATILASACFLASSASAALVINDPGFEGGTASLVQVNTTFTDTDNALDEWVIYGNDFDPDDRNFTMPATGGNPDGYLDGTFGNSTSYRRAMYQAVTDDKATTGLMDFTFDLNLVDVSAFSTTDLNVAIWGIVDDTSSFSFSTTGTAVFNATIGAATLLASSTYGTDTTGWQKQTITGVNFGTGYDIVVIGFKSNSYSNADTVRIDNVAVIPEPSSLMLVASALVACFGFLHRKRG